MYVCIYLSLSVCLFILYYSYYCDICIQYTYILEINQFKQHKIIA